MLDFESLGVILEKSCLYALVLSYAMEHASSILHLSLSWMKANMAVFKIRSVID